jgi:hypothetical protein
VIVDLGYCYNVLPGETVAALLDQVRRYCGPVRARLGLDRMGVGLWIARGAATELVRDPAALRALAAALADERLYCFTLNGFPFGGFHAQRVKHRVFEPTWADAPRVDYTIDLARILSALLPDDLERGTISTVPLGPATVDRAAAAAGLRRAAAALGDRIQLAIEPEPGAGFERAGDLARWLAEVDLGPAIGVCVDCCHAAVVGEDVTAIPATKIQISSALVAARPDDPDTRRRLVALDEPRFLHQVRSDRGGAPDLPEALDSLDPGAPWRIHFHVPVHRELVAGLATTRDAIRPVVAAALAAPGPAPHLEVETYTWSVLPAAEQVDLVDGIAAELAWTIELLGELGATPR